MERILLTFVVLLGAIQETRAQCQASQHPAGYWGTGTGDVEVVCGTTGRVSGSATNLQLSRGQARHITTLPVGTTDFSITMFATSDVDTLLLRGCSNGNCPYSRGTTPNYGQCMAGYSCENACRWSNSGCTWCSSAKRENLNDPTLSCYHEDVKYLTRVICVTHLYHKKIARTATLKCTLKYHT